MHCNERRDRPKIEARRLVERRGLNNWPSHTLNVFWYPSRTGTASWRPLHNWFSCAKRFNPSEYCVTNRDHSITRDIELSTEKTLNSNNRIVISKKLLDGKNAVLNVPLLHGYWTDPIGTILRQSGEVANLHSPDYYPFQKHTFFLRHPVLEISVYAWNVGIYAATPPSSRYFRWQFISTEWITEHSTEFQSMLGIDVLPDITDIKYYLISFFQNWNEFLSLSPIMFCYQTNRFTSPPSSSCPANSMHVLLNVVWKVIIEYMTEI